MDVRLSPEQRALRDAAGQLVQAHGPRSVAALAEADRTAKLAAALAGSGWRELRAAPPGEEPLASTVEVALVAEALGRGLADTAFLGPSLAAELRRRAGLPLVTAAGTETVLFQHDLLGPSIADGRGKPCSGLAVDAQLSRSALALAPSEDGYEIVAVPVPAADGPGRDLTRPVVGVVDALAERVGGTLSPDDLTGWHAFALAVACADLVGVMRGATELACDYAKIRHQYGVPIGSFQSLQHLLADAHVVTEGSISVTRHAAWAVDHVPAADALAAAAIAKAYCARAARAVCETAVQVHGGIGNTWECLAHVYLRRALLSIQVLGDAGVNLARVMAHQGIGGVQSGLR